MKRFAICYNKEISHSADVKDELFKALKNKNIEAEILDVDNLKIGSDFVFVIGGDGTILKTARFFAKEQIPIFGINYGRLGFLSQSSQKNIDVAVDKILNNEFITEDRIMLQSSNFYALNDFVIKSCETGRTSKFSLKINEKYVCDYLADGIIISTPTGSTAYGLSAGGPVLESSLNAFVIVPICPHTLNARPIVVPDSEVITVCAENKSLVSADGQEFYEINSEIEIKKSEYCAKLALLEDTNFYSVLRDKLHWATHPEYQN